MSLIIGLVCFAAGTVIGATHKEMTLFFYEKYKAIVKNWTARQSAKRKN